MINMCVFCGDPSCIPVLAGDKRYFACPECGGLFLDRSQLLSRSDEKKRYTLHENSLENTGYRQYLESFIESVGCFKDIREAGVSAGSRVFDYGSGPEPSLVRLLGERGFDARGFDPYFAPDTPRFPGGADIVTCLEVAEHFADPVRDFALAAECLRPEGFMAVGTHLVDDLGEGKTAEAARDANEVFFIEDDTSAHADAFRCWWYRQDPTHISFYSKKALCLAAKKSSLVWKGQAAPHVYIFRKEGGQ